MSKAKMYGRQTGCVPNRDADRRRGSRFYRNTRDWTWRHDEALQEQEEKKETKEMARMKAEVQEDG